ncbi:MAG: hypothetical protein ACYDHZ_04710 [Dehalococcoidia bacterium]
MTSTPVRGKSVATGKPTSVVAKLLHNGLNIVVGILTFSAFICAVMFFSSGGYNAESISAQTVSAGALQDKINLESQSVNAGNTGGSRNASLSGGASNMGGTGGTYSTGGNAGNPGTAGTSTDVASASSSGGTGGNASTDTGGAVGSSTAGTGGQSTVAGNTGNGGSGGSDSAGNGSTGGSSSSLNRIKSACFGGVGHCYNGK